MKKIFVLLILAIFALLFVATLRNSSEPEENYEMLQHIIIDDTSQLVSIAESQDYVPIHSFGVRIDNWVINNSCTQSYQNYYQHEQIGYFTPGISPNHGKIPVREKILLDVSWDDRYLLLTRSGTLSVYSLERDLLVDQPMNVELDNIATADWSVNNQIVFESDRDIYILDLATDEVSNVTSSREREYFPQWTPDGEKLVFVRVYENPE